MKMTQEADGTITITGITFDEYMRLQIATETYRNQAYTLAKNMKRADLPNNMEISRAILAKRLEESLSPTQMNWYVGSVRQGVSDSVDQTLKDLREKLQEWDSNY